ncbi:hypothetical protein DUNSADRAFT_6933 [Dunaliella salina]|uniref:Encoded protein n=1 Tax=Dunaliella salina TaxID=3046 RepID=A0ABQ7GMC0_DUNSA|nr:hypothetical protein DUNSADRAFT_6933 [Dunaliella salina]|eukprot:KAF5835752.1 hypothetical protein DUNSADRAFT_6933 [Dunaliella salina]
MLCALTPGIAGPPWPDVCGRLWLHKKCQGSQGVVRQSGCQGLQNARCLLRAVEGLHSAAFTTLTGIFCVSYKGI